MGIYCGKELVEMDGTVVQCFSIGENIVVKVSIDKYYGDNHNTEHFYLAKSHPNFIELYQKIQINKTYTFDVDICLSGTYIVNINDARIYVFNSIILGIIDLDVEKIENCVELITNRKLMRFIVDKKRKDQITIGKLYEITYTKWLYKDFYQVLKLKNV